MQQRLFKTVSQLELKYRGKLTEFSRGRALIQPGDRAPDVVFARRSAKVSLFELLGKFGMIALLGPAPNNHSIVASLGALKISAFVVAEGQLEDVNSDFARLYGVHGSFFCLIRPDGHVGLFQSEAEPRSIAAYLKKMRAAPDVENAFGYRS